MMGVMPYATHAEIDLSAVEFNLTQVRSLIGERRVLAAVKANAYGHGAVTVARHIEQTGAADWLGVATVDEGAELREAGVGLPILKLSHCFDDELDAALAADLALTVVNEATMREADAAAARAGRCVSVHLKIDTGMRRIGAEPSEAVRLAQCVDSATSLRLEGVFTHLPISDHPRGAEFTRAQLGLFETLVAEIEAARGPVELVHAANSGAILSHDLGRTTLARPGIMIYGHYPDRATPRTVELRKALRLVSRVSFVKRIDAGETVGYGRTYTASEPTHIATVPIGYADGYSRKLSNRGRVLIGGRSHPIAGTVCMDQIMVDLGPEPPGVSVGDGVTLIGRDGEEEITVDEIAELMGTIPYEVTCLLSPRVSREY